MAQKNNFDSPFKSHYALTRTAVSLYSHRHLKRVKNRQKFNMKIIVSHLAVSSFYLDCMSISLVDSSDSAGKLHCHSVKGEASSCGFFLQVFERAGFCLFFFTAWYLVFLFTSLRSSPSLYLGSFGTFHAHAPLVTSHRHALSLWVFPLEARVAAAFHFESLVFLFSFLNLFSFPFLTTDLEFSRPLCLCPLKVINE